MKIYSNSMANFFNLKGTGILETCFFIILISSFMQDYLSCMIYPINPWKINSENEICLGVANIQKTCREKMTGYSCKQQRYLWKFPELSRKFYLSNLPFFGSEINILTQIPNDTQQLATGVINRETSGIILSDNYISIIFLLAIWYALNFKQSGKIYFWLMILLPNICFAAPLLYKSSTTGGGGAGNSIITGVSATINQHYCTLSISTTGTGYQYIISKYYTNGTVIAQDYQGTIPSGSTMPSAIHSIVDVQGGCVNTRVNYVSGAKTDVFDLCTGVTSCPEYSWTTGAFDTATKLIQTVTGAYLLIGYDTASTTSWLGYLTDITGFQWITSYASVQFQGVIQLADSSYRIIGVSGAQCVFIPGNLMVSQSTNTTLSITGTSNCMDLFAANNSTIFTFGSNLIGSTSKGLAVKLDNYGNILATYTFGGGPTDTFNSGLIHPDGTIYLAGKTSLITNGGNDGWLIAIDINGNTLWQANYGTPADENFMAIAIAGDSRLVCVGSSGTSMYSVSVVLQCSGATVLNLAGTDCVSACSPGYFYAYNVSTCMPCAPGTNSSSPGFACDLCPRGYYQDYYGQTSCKPCSINSYSNLPGSTTCTACPVGYYQCQFGQTICPQCPKPFCGPCQFNDRTICDQLVGICWPYYDNVCITGPNLTQNCLSAVAKICYAIWLVNGTNDPQCADFTSSFNMELMKKKPNLRSAAYAVDGQSFTLVFDTAINQNQFTDASVVFDAETLKWIPSSKSATWLSSTTLNVAYNPQVGILTKLTLLNNSIYNDYKYAQVPADAANFSVSSNFFNY